MRKISYIAGSLLSLISPQLNQECIERNMNQMYREESRIIDNAGIDNYNLDMKKERQLIDDGEIKLAGNLYWARLVIVAKPMRVAVC